MRGRAQRSGNLADNQRCGDELPESEIPTQHPLVEDHTPTSTCAADARFRGYTECVPANPRESGGRGNPVRPVLLLQMPGMMVRVDGAVEELATRITCPCWC